MDILLGAIVAIFGTGVSLLGGAIVMIVCAFAPIILLIWLLFGKKK